MMAPGLILKSKITEHLAALRSQPNKADRIFRGVGAEERAQIKTWLADPKKPIHIRSSWTTSAAQMPCIAITVPGEQEGQQYVGSDPGAMYDSDTDSLVDADYEEDGVWYEGQVTGFAGSVDAAVYSLNGQDIEWLVAIVKWIMLRIRRDLEDLGLEDQKITITDYMPANEYPAPDPAYTRVVKLSYTTLTYYAIDTPLDPDDPAGLPVTIIVQENP